jgi:hypothetical protein
MINLKACMRPRSRRMVAAFWSIAYGLAAFGNMRLTSRRGERERERERRQTSPSSVALKRAAQPGDRHQRRAGTASQAGDRVNGLHSSRAPGARQNREHWDCIGTRNALLRLWIAVRSRPAEAERCSAQSALAVQNRVLTLQIFFSIVAPADIA